MDIRSEQGSMVPEGWRPGAGCARSARGLWRRISPTGNNIGNEDQDLRIRSVKCHAAELNSQSFAPPGASAPRVASASQPAKLRRRASESAPDPQPEDLRAPPSAGASRDVRAPTRKVTATRQRTDPHPQLEVSRARVSVSILGGRGSPHHNPKRQRGCPGQRRPAVLSRSRFVCRPPIVVCRNATLARRASFEVAHLT